MVANKKLRQIAKFCFFLGAREGTRTPMDEPPDPKSGASTNFATRAYSDIITRLLNFDKNTLAILGKRRIRITIGE